MGIFTVYDDPRVDRHILTDCAHLTKIVLSRIQDVVGIALVGGFGRGEGSVLISGETIQPINDYDLIVFIPSSAQKRAMDVGVLKTELSSGVKIRQVDVAVFGLDELSGLSKKMAVYDIKNCAKFIYGDESILRGIPHFGPEELMARESRIPIFLYLGALLQAFPSRDDSGLPQEKFWCAQQISKAVIGWSTAHLVLAHEYAASYRVRKQKALVHFANDPDKSGLIDFAYEFKLRPQYPVEKLIYPLWEKAVLEYKKAMFAYFCTYYGCQFTDWRDIVRRVRYDPQIVARKIYAYLVGNTSYLQYERLNLIKLLLCISHGVDQGGFLELANKELSLLTKWDLGKEWEDARKELCRISPDNVMFLTGNDTVFMSGQGDYVVS